MLTASLLSIAAATLPAARLLIGLWLMLSSAQLIAAAGVFGPDGRLAWARIARIRSDRWRGAARRRMSVAAWRSLTGALAAIGVALVIGVSDMALIVALLAALMLYGLALFLSGDFWGDGSDKIGMLALAGTAITAIGIWFADPTLALAGLLLTGGQLTLCYAIAGLSKLPDPRWRDGSMLDTIMRTEWWGHGIMRRLFRMRGMARAASWIVILLEALFPLALLWPPLLAVALAGMMAFHIATALLMGLNRFPWAFACAYPATFALGQAIALSFRPGA